MFYDKQPDEKQQKYKKALALIGQLSPWFSDSSSPYLHYRYHENVFSHYFDMENNARSDDSADAYDPQLQIGVGLKTWVGGDRQKVAEFGRLRPEYRDLTGLELVRKIASFRNKRIQTTKRIHNLKTLFYHIVKRVEGKMQIFECPFDEIDLENITVDLNRGGANTTYFSDGKHSYHFSSSKNTLYMDFSSMELLDEVPVKILENAYSFLENKLSILSNSPLEKSTVATGFNQNNADRLCLRLYSTKKRTNTKFVPEKSGLNQWNGNRTQYRTNSDNTRTLIKKTPRNPYEVYIPYPAEDRVRKEFFPPRDTPFTLQLPNGKSIVAKVCQAGGKAIMSNPNSDLGKWLFEDVFGLPLQTQITYDMLKEFNIDSVMFTKINNSTYKIEFCPLGTYEEFYSLPDIDSED